MIEDSLQLVGHLAALLSKRKLKICTAESCTGGLIAKSFTDLPGSSAWFERGFVSYSNAAKTEMLGVPEALIEDYGAVSEAVASAMASGALQHSAADLAIAVTGVAGPDGGSEDKPVGTVWIALAAKEQMVAKKYLFSGDRGAIRQATLTQATENLLQLLETS
jgi:nicotinamide-nucleotide amidase